MRYFNLYWGARFTSYLRRQLGVSDNSRSWKRVVFGDCYPNLMTALFNDKIFSALHCYGDEK